MTLPPALRFALPALILPNLIPFGFSLAGIGFPPRPFGLVIYAVLAALSHRMPLFLLSLCYAMAAALDALFVISSLFGLSPLSALPAIRFALSLNFAQSPLYMGLALGTLGLALLSLVLASRWRKTFAPSHRIPSLAAILLIIPLDLTWNTSPYFAFGPAMAPAGPVQSAVAMSGLSRLKPGHDVLLVLVESYGALKDEALRNQVESPFASQEIAKRYQVERGEVSYYGATPEGEMRELCATRDHYRTRIARADPDCLPARLRRDGYRTMALQAFPASFFDLNLWYPNIGFDRQTFLEDLAPELSRTCGGVFLSACDTDLVERILPQLDQADRPTFFYWVTMNTHTPIAPGQAPKDFVCANPDTQPEACQLGALWNALFARLATLALQPRNRPLEILLVGDHAPPLWSRKGRQSFLAGQAGWIRLRPRNSCCAAPPLE
jgi:hypothetical protein